MPPPEPTILERITTELNQQLWARLVLFADDSVKRHYWHGILGGPAVSGTTGEDYLQDAVMKTLKGVRRWQPENCSLEQHLRGAIKSAVNHDSEELENRLVLRGSSLAREETDPDVSPLDRFPADCLRFEDVERGREWDNLILEFLDYLADDSAVQQLFEALYDGILKRADLAKHLGVTELLVDSTRKRLATRVKKFREMKTQQLKEVPHV